MRGVLLALLVGAPLASGFINPVLRPTTPTRGRAAARTVRPVGTLKLPEAFTVPNDRVVAALDLAGGSATAADVASAAGMSLAEAKSELTKIAGLLAANEETSVSVDNEGDIRYTFPGDVTGALKRRSRLTKWRGRWRNHIKPFLKTTGRTMFGVGMVANVAAVFTLLSVVTSSGRSDDDGGGGGMSFRLSTWDLMLIIDLLRFGSGDDRRTYEAIMNGEEIPMSTMEAVYSYVFGDGDPNNELEAYQLACAAAAIRQAGGAVTADDLAPYLDPPPLPASSNGLEGPEDGPLGALAESANVDEDWVLPAVTALGGVPEVTEDGDLVYVFDDLMATADRYEAAAMEAYGRLGSVAPVEEVEAPFSLATKGQTLIAAGLGGLDLLGVLLLGKALVARGLMPAMNQVYAPLAAYAVAYNAIPLVRNWRRERANEKIRVRNERRRAWAAKPKRSVGRRLKARVFGEGSDGAGAGVAFDSSEDVNELAERNEAEELKKFDALIGLAGASSAAEQPGLPGASSTEDPLLRPLTLSSERPSEAAVGGGAGSAKEPMPAGMPAGEGTGALDPPPRPPQ